MAKYDSYAELEKKAPKNWVEGLKTGVEAYEENLAKLAPPGKSLKRSKVEKLKAKANESYAKKWLDRWVDAMFE